MHNHFFLSILLYSSLFDLVIVLKIIYLNSSLFTLKFLYSQGLQMKLEMLVYFLFFFKNEKLNNNLTHACRQLIYVAKFWRYRSPSNYCNLIEGKSWMVKEMMVALANTSKAWEETFSNPLFSYCNNQEKMFMYHLLLAPKFHDKIDMGLCFDKILLDGQSWVWHDTFINKWNTTSIRENNLEPGLNLLAKNFKSILCILLTQLNSQ